MKKTYKDGKLVESRAKPEISAVDWDTLEAQLMRATNRTDLLDAEEIGYLALLISPDNKHPKTGETLPIPAPLREFIWRAFVEIAGGTQAADALRMIPKGRRKEWKIEDKVMACTLVNTLIKNGAKPTSAYKLAAQWINDQFSQIDTDEKKSTYMQYPAWNAFFGKKLAWSHLRDWYAEYDPASLGARLKEK